MSVLARVTDPAGRVVVLTSDAWRHILDDHLELAGSQAGVVSVVERPDHVEPDPRPGRERFWREGVGPSRWLRVVVDFSMEPAEIITAFGDRKGPAGWTA